MQFTVLTSMAMLAIALKTKALLIEITNVCWLLGESNGLEVRNTKVYILQAVPLLFFPFFWS